MFSRLVHSGKHVSTLGSGDYMTFGTRSGTRQGVEAHVFRVECQRDVSAWSRALVQGAHTAAVLVKEVSCREYNHIYNVDFISSFCILIAEL